MALRATDPAPGVPLCMRRGAQLWADQGWRCLSGASLARPRPKRAPQVPAAPAQGADSGGSLSFGYFSLAAQRKVTAPPGAYPASGYCGIQHGIDHHKPIKIHKKTDPSAHPTCTSSYEKQSISYLHRLNERCACAGSRNTSAGYSGPSFRCRVCRNFYICIKPTYFANNQSASHFQGMSMDDLSLSSRFKPQGLRCTSR